MIENVQLQDRLSLAKDVEMFLAWTSTHEDFSGSACNSCTSTYNGQLKMQVFTVDVCLHVCLHVCVCVWGGVRVCVRASARARK